MKLTKEERAALKKVYKAILEARAIIIEPCGADKWLLWRELDIMDARIWNAIGCPKQEGDAL